MFNKIQIQIEIIIVKFLSCVMLFWLLYIVLPFHGELKFLIVLSKALGYTGIYCIYLKTRKCGLSNSSVADDFELP